MQTQKGSVALLAKVSAPHSSPNEEKVVLVGALGLQSLLAGTANPQPALKTLKLHLLSSGGLRRQFADETAASRGVTAAALASLALAEKTLQSISHGAVHPLAVKPALSVGSRRA